MAASWQLGMHPYQSFAVGILSGFGAALALFMAALPYHLARQALHEAID